MAAQVASSIGSTIIIIGTAISGFGSITGDVLASPRLLFAGARDGLLPKFLGKAHPRFATPYWSVIIYAALIFIFAISGGFRQLAILASGTLLLIYLGVALSVLKLRRKKENISEQGFRLPGGFVIPIIAAVTIIWFLSHLSKNEALSIVVALAILSAIYLVMTRTSRSATRVKL